jgi:hypothetical protein
MTCNECEAAMLLLHFYQSIAPDPKPFTGTDRLDHFVMTMSKGLGMLLHPNRPFNGAKFPAFDWRYKLVHPLWVPLRI